MVGNAGISKRIRDAGIVAWIVPAALLVGAYIGQYGFNLYPCEMCWWQRWPHFMALAFATAALTSKLAYKPFCIAIAAIAIFTSGMIGGYHAGVEYHLWEGITACTSTIQAGNGSYLDKIMKAPMIRCDRTQWALFGISLAGYNFIISTIASIIIAKLLLTDRKRTA